MATTEARRPRLARRLLASPVVDLLLGPHGVDRYLELIDPRLTLADARAEVIGVRRQTARSVTLVMRPNFAWPGFTAGQFVPVGIEIAGVRRTRTLSPAGSEHSGSELEFTVTEHPGGAVSGHLVRSVKPGALIHLGRPQGALGLHRPRPQRLVLISGGSGITPVMSMLRTLVDEGHSGEIAFLHYARTEADWLYEPEVRAMAARHPGLQVSFRTTRGERPERLTAHSLQELMPGLDSGAHAAVCGPPALIEAARLAWALAGGEDERLRAETFTPHRTATPADGDPDGTLHFLRSRRSAPAAAGTLLEQAEAAGLAPAFGCRMGICHTCTCRKATGPVRNLLSGEVSEEEDEDIQLCVSVPAGDVALHL